RFSRDWSSDVCSSDLRHSSRAPNCPAPLVPPARRPSPGAVRRRAPVTRLAPQHSFRRQFMSALISVPQSTRRHDLDWLRVFAFGALIFYHIGMFYVTWGWHVKSDHASPFLEPAMSLLNPWRLALLFFISGVALRFAADARGFKALLPKRGARLFVPLAFGMLVLVVPQAYFELCYKGEFRGSIV